MGTSGCGDNIFNIEPFSPGPVLPLGWALGLSAADWQPLCPP